MSQRYLEFKTFKTELLKQQHLLMMSILGAPILVCEYHFSLKGAMPTWRIGWFGGVEKVQDGPGEPCGSKKISKC